MDKRKLVGPILVAIAVFMLSSPSHAEGRVYGSVGYQDYPWNIFIGYSDHGRDYYQPRYVERHHYYQPRRHHHYYNGYRGHGRQHYRQYSHHRPQYYGYGRGHGRGYGHHNRKHYGYGGGGRGRH